MPACALQKGLVGTLVNGQLNQDAQIQKNILGQGANILGQQMNQDANIQNSVIGAINKQVLCKSLISAQIARLQCLLSYSIGNLMKLAAFLLSDESLMCMILGCECKHKKEVLYVLLRQGVHAAILLLRKRDAKGGAYTGVQSSNLVWANDVPSCASAYFRLGVCE